MPKTNGVLTLPVNIREELEKRLVKTGYGSSVAHANWLKSIGHPVSKSTIARYAAHNRAKIEGKSGAASMTDFEIASLKLQCLAICPESEDRFKKAIELFEWATNDDYKYLSL